MNELRRLIDKTAKFNDGMEDFKIPARILAEEANTTWLSAADLNRRLQSGVPIKSGEFGHLVNLCKEVIKYANFTAKRAENVIDILNKVKKEK